MFVWFSEGQQASPTNDYLVEGLQLTGETAGEAEALAGSIAGVASLTGTLSAAVPLAGSIAAVASLTGDLISAVSAEGRILCFSSLTGDLSAAVPLAGSIAVQGSLIGTLDIVEPATPEIDVDLRTKLLESSTITDILGEDPIVQQNKLSQCSGNTAICYMRRSNTTDRTNIGGSLLVHTGFDVECYSDDIDTCMDLANAVKELLDGFQGYWDETFVHLCEVEDHSDDYMPKLAGSDDGLHLAALDIQVTH